MTTRGESQTKSSGVSPSQRHLQEKRDRILTVIASGAMSIVCQPIREVEGRLVGFEALSRFAAFPVRSPDRWFAEAREVGLQSFLELCAIESALGKIELVPQSAFLAVNASARTLVGDPLRELLRNAAINRTVVELTEDLPIDDYATIRKRLAPLRRDGLRLAVDDLGAGHSNLTHILNLHPDFVKLDANLTRNIEQDSVRQALIKALVNFCFETGSTLIAEGVETTRQLDALRSLGVKVVQGYHVGRPIPIDHLPAGASKTRALNPPSN